VTEPGGYSFAATGAFSVDAQTFLDTVAAGARLIAAGSARQGLAAFAAALEQWGEPLPEFADEPWAASYRSRIARAYLEALGGGASAALAIGDHARAITLAEAAVAREPLREPSHLLLVRARAASGDSAGALAAFEEFRRRLAAELGLDPSVEAFDVQRWVLRGARAGDIGRGGSPKARGAPVGDLPFVGRDAEMATITSALARPGPQVVLVAGPPGSGKSRLLAEIAGSVEGTFLDVRAHLPEVDEPWSLGRSLLRKALAVSPRAAESLPGRVAGALADVIPELDGLRTGDAAPVSAESRRALALEGAAQLLLQATADSRMTLLVDDLQWADATSLGLVWRLAREDGGPNLLVAYRPEERMEVFAASMAQDVRGPASVLQMVLGRLPFEAICELVSDPRLASVLATESMPFAVHELLRHLGTRELIELDGTGRWRPRSDGTLDEAAELARAGQRRSIETRLRQQGMAACKTIGLLSLLGRETPARVVARILETEETAVLHELDRLAHAELVRVGPGGWAPAHDFVAQTLREGMDASDRACLHGLIARTLQAEEGDPSELATHLIGAGDRTAAAAALEKAAKESLERYASEEAERLADIGLGLDPPPARALALLEARAEARARRGDSQGARSDLRQIVAAKHPGPDRARTLIRIAELTSGSEDYEHASEVVELALSEAGEDTRVRARALGVASVLDVNLNRADRAQQRSEEALRLFEQAGDAFGAATILDVRATAAFFLGEFRRAADLLDRVVRLFSDAGDLLRVQTPRGMRGLCLTFLDQPERALEDLADAEQSTVALGLHEDRPAVLWCQSEALAVAARVPEAVELAEEAFAMADRAGHREWTCAALLGLGGAWLAGRDSDRAETALRRCLGIAERLPGYYSWASARLASTLIADGRVAEAEPFLAQAFEGPPFSHYEGRLAKSQLLAATGDPGASAYARQAIRLADAGGHLVSVRALRALSERAGVSKRGD
jgi:tetratricopeptide (TPR) repeat protein